MYDLGYNVGESGNYAQFYQIGALAIDMPGRLTFRE
jgi:hypothetical protein